MNNHTEISSQSFCQAVCSKKRPPLNLFVSEDFLSLDEGGDRTEDHHSWITTQPIVTLTDLLKSPTTLPRRHRYILISLITKAVWQFYGTGWLTAPWTTANVQFIVERRKGVVGIYPNEPFISAPLFNDEQAASGSKKLWEIKALGVMLLEIEMGILIDEEMRKLPDYKDLIVSDEYFQAAYTAAVILEDQDKVVDIPDILKTVIRDCLKPDQLRHYQTEPVALRDAMKRIIVRPILELVELLYQNHDAAPPIHLEKEQRYLNCDPNLEHKSKIATGLAVGLLGQG